MSTKTLIDDAEHLWASGRTEGAWVLALIAAAATARKRYPSQQLPAHDNAPTLARLRRRSQLYAIR